MNIGASSSCFYPLETEKSLLLVGKAGIRITEVFFNSPSELEVPFIKQLEKIKNEYSMDITAVHPFMSFAEGYNIFSSYRRRFDDSLELFKKYFEAAAALGARFLNLTALAAKKQFRTANTPTGSVPSLRREKPSACASATKTWYIIRAKRRSLCSICTLSSERISK